MVSSDTDNFWTLSLTVVENSGWNIVQYYTVILNVLRHNHEQTENKTRTVSVMNKTKHEYVLADAT